ncbi:hypothetical protein I5M27_03205 [Adhaeribacter sp. BT258]|uniref:PH domain-containing protein n=1 Tax=Adhaeribacter terrigena TaxID=2793070 RepID=A0ABS1BYH6_9BACT|nr:hypothetical protein [Adhaeribacter terrigena]MBK0401976.1 hypothetical protein [Adhaeribacter terrigena]
MRSLLRVGIRPLKNSRISFGVQLAIVFFWLAYGSALLFTEPDTNDRSYLHIVFLVLAFLYLLYILAQNTSIFGTQSYLEITPAYIVQKKGHFRPKQVIAFDDVTSVQILPTTLRFKLKNGEQETMDLKSLKRRKNIELVREKLQLMSERHRFALSADTFPR